MADNGMIGNGARVGYRVAGSPLAAYTVIGQILSIEGAEWNRAVVDRTVHSDNDFERDLPGMIRIAPLQLTLLANPDELQGEGIVQQALQQLFLDGTTVEWRIEKIVDRAHTDFKGYVFDGFISQISPMDTPIKERQEFMCTIVFDDDDVTVDAAGASLLG